MSAKNPESRFAVFAGGCFWCMEPPFDRLSGVISTSSGYSGGDEKNPKYEQVSAGKTGHLEVIRVEYDPKKIRFQELLDTYWKQVDPTDNEGQFVDRGRQYTTAIFYSSEEEKKIAEKSKQALGKSGRFKKKIVTKILPLKSFYPAEDYHQDYYQRNPIRYKFYRYQSGRDQYIEKKWKEDQKNTSKTETSKGEFKMPTKKELKEKLSDIQYKVTQEDGTEAPFKNEYWDNKAEGIYVDVVSGEPLFSSTDKFDSGTGWPSFTKPIKKDFVETKADFKLFARRIEVRSKKADSHLGHVFEDGPNPTGMRYCINSAALRFIPKEKLKEEGFEHLLELFQNK